MVENFLELIDVDSVEEPNCYENAYDLSVEEDASFTLSCGIISHNSASAAVRKHRDPMFQGAFPLRGKFLNVAELTPTKIIQNQEVKDLVSALGLKLGEDPTDLRYGKILIYADADPDGDSIAGLLVNFLGRYWPKLFEDKRVYRVMTPLVVAQQGTDKKLFYTAAEFESWSKNISLAKWDIGYKKGLAALEDESYREIIKNPVLVTLLPGEHPRRELDLWFGSDTSGRKSKILGISEDDEEPSPIEVDDVS